MHTQPRIFTRTSQPFVALRRTVRLPFGDVVDATLPQLWQWLADNEIEPAGAPFFKYNVVDMARELEIDFGVPTAELTAADGPVVAGLLPSGRYAGLTHHGHYDQLIDATGDLFDWVRAQGEVFDMEETPEGDRFACRLEIYTNDPGEVPNPDDWETVLAFRLRD